MVVVAIAGGSSPTLGRSIVTAILEAGVHTPIILSRFRTDAEAAPETKYGALIRYVDYGSVSSLARGLDGVHSVISVLKSTDPSEMLDHHCNLLEAARRAGCRRFAPSEWETGPLTKHKVGSMRVKLDIWTRCRDSGLECARFMPGWFMNYLGQGCPEERREEAIAGLDDDLLLDYIDIGRATLTVPLTDDGRPAKVTMTEIGDVGRFVAAALDLADGNWEQDMGMVGSTVDLDEISRKVEHVTGREVEVRRLKRPQLKTLEDAFDRELEKHFSIHSLKRKMVAQLMQCACDEQLGDQIIDPVLNRLCPQVHPLGFDQYLERFWST